MEKFKVIVIGAGSRGQAYTDIMKDRYSDRYEVVGVADPNTNRREYIKSKHNIPEENCVDTWQEILDRPKFADVAIISTQDKEHFEPAIKAMNMGYHLLLEKPVSPVPEECVEIEKCAKKNNVKVVVCHVLRYTPFFSKIKELIMQDKIGRVMNVIHLEGVGNLHQSHSYVRGNWRNLAESSPMILAKSCHDTDIIQWLVDDECVGVQSFGELTYFKEENAPVGAPERCTDGCPVADTCPYSAIKLYYDHKKNEWFRPVATGKTDPTDEDVMEALKTTNYGRCVFRCDNDVVDHQVVNLMFKGGAVASFTMSAFNKGGRQIKVMGTKGELTGRAKEEKISLYDFETKTTTEINCNSGNNDEDLTGGHGGGDFGIVKSFYEVLTDTCDSSLVSGIEISCKNHLISFAAEKSRLENIVVNPNELCK